MQRVSDERLFQNLLNHRMAAFADTNTRLIAKSRAAVVEGLRALGEVHQHIELRQRAGALLQIAKMRQQHIEKFIVQLLFQRQRLPFGGQHFVFILLQLRNNIALGVLEGLATDVVDRRMLALTAANLDVVAVDGIVAYLQRVQPQALALANFQSVEVIGRAIGQPAPLIEFRVIAGGDNAAVANQYRRRIDNRPFQQFAQLAKFPHLFPEPLYWRTVDVPQHRAQCR